MNFHYVIVIIDSILLHTYSFAIQKVFKACNLFFEFREMDFYNSTAFVPESQIFSRSMDTVQTMLSRYPNRMSSNPCEGRTKISFRKLSDLTLFC